MTTNELRELGRRFRREAEEDIAAGLAANVDPHQELIAIVRDLMQAQQPAPKSACNSTSESTDKCRPVERALAGRQVAERSARAIDDGGALDNVSEVLQAVARVDSMTSARLSRPLCIVSLGGDEGPGDGI
jgi:hypothetical protein